MQHLASVRVLTIVEPPPWVLTYLAGLTDPLEMHPSLQQAQAAATARPTGVLGGRSRARQYKHLSWNEVLHPHVDAYSEMEIIILGAGQIGAQPATSPTGSRLRIVDRRRGAAPPAPETPGHPRVITTAIPSHPSTLRRGKICR